MIDNIKQQYKREKRRTIFHLLMCHASLSVLSYLSLKNGSPSAEHYFVGFFFGILFSNNSSNLMKSFLSAYDLRKDLKYLSKAKFTELHKTLQPIEYTPETTPESNQHARE